MSVNSNDEQDNEVAEKASWFSIALGKISSGFKNHFGNHKFFYTFMVFLSLLILFVLRAYLQEYIMVAREYSFIVIYLISIIFLLWLFKKLKVKTWRVIVISILFGVGISGFIYIEGQQYLALYYKYESSTKQEVFTLPTTKFERVQPLNSIFVQAGEKITETESVSIPDLAIIDNDLKFVMEISPTYWGQKFFDGEINELFSISSTISSPDFSKREKVNFSEGENLVLAKKSKNAVIKSLNPWEYFNCFPTDVKRLKDDTGKWVQVVSLAKWEGFFFPHPEFAGVQIIKQNDVNRSVTEKVSHWMKRFFIGMGDFIPANEISKHHYLKGQNLVPYIVSRNIANSYRFQDGIFGPLKSYHIGDVRIPDMPGDNNEQPFVVWFEGIDGKSGLFHYFGLEPYDEHKHGLSISLFIPADGSTEVIYYYDHKQQGLTGSSAIGDKVIESKKNYDWSKNRPVETRPYIKNINGENRFFWLTTVATVNKEGNMAGSIPETVITDAATNLPVWVDSKHPKQWLDTVKKEMSSVIGISTTDSVKKQTQEVLEIVEDNYSQIKQKAKKVLNEVEGVSDSNITDKNSSAE
jgi:hypothetical protein